MNGIDRRQNGTFEPRTRKLQFHSNVRETASQTERENERANDQSKSIIKLRDCSIIIILVVVMVVVTRKKIIDQKQNRTRKKLRQNSLDF